jgi:hypothetical protein
MKMKEKTKTITEGIERKFIEIMQFEKENFDSLKRKILTVWKDGGVLQTPCTIYINFQSMASSHHGKEKHNSSDFSFSLSIEKFS